jgi:hypothetical protein
MPLPSTLETQLMYFVTFLDANNIHDGKTLCEGAFFKINCLVVDFLQPNHPCHLTDVRFLCKLETKAVYYMRMILKYLKVSKKG